MTRLRSIAMLFALTAGLVTTVSHGEAAAPPLCFGRRATMVGGPGNNSLRGTRKADVIVGLGGNDRIKGRSGNDRICGGKGNDRLSGGAGHDAMQADAGNDRLISGGSRGDDRLYGSKGADTAIFSASRYGIEVFLNREARGRNFSARLHSIEGIVGTPTADAIFAGSGSDVDRLPERTASTD
jgi:hypothetical protein